MMPSPETVAITFRAHLQNGSNLTGQYGPDWTIFTGRLHAQ